MAIDEPSVAFYAPMKPPDHPTPSGDRQIARHVLAALREAGFAPEVISSLRTLDMAGDPDIQADLAARAEAEAECLISKLAAAPPALWFTYHCYYKAPDLVGPRVSRALAIPYVISEPSISPRRRAGPWAGFAAASEAAIAAADLLFWTTARDRPALEQAGHMGKMIHLPAFVDAGSAPVERPAGQPLRLLAVAMMRPGDKVESYRRLAAALARLEGCWRLDICGGGAARADVEALFGGVGGRVTFHGATDDPAALRRAYEAADVFVWPGVNEGVGQVYLEAQAAGLPVAAEDHPAQRELVAGPLAAPDRPDRFAALISSLAADRAAASHAARKHVEDRHSIASAAQILRTSLRPLIL